MAARSPYACRAEVSGRMIRIASVLLGICLLSLPVSAFAQIAFERMYGDSGGDDGYDARQTADGGYIIVGHTSSFGAGGTDVYLIKTDSLGDTLWTRAYGGSLLEFARCVRQTSDGGYIVVGTTESFGAGERDIYLIKTDSAGDTLWTRTYGGIRSEFGFAVMQTLDGGYIIVGETASFGAGMADVYVVKTDAAGDTLWTRTYGRAGDDKCYSVDHAWGGGYVFGGHSQSPNPYHHDFFLLRTDTLGNTLWSRVYNRWDNDYGRCARQTADGGYIIVGEYVLPVPPGSDMFAIKTDSAGDTLWTGTYGGDKNEWGCSVDQTYIGNYVFVGTSWSFSPDLYPDVYVVEVNSWGLMIDFRVFGDPPLWGTYGRSVQQALDGGYIISGFGYPDDPSRGSEVYLIKTPGIAQEIHDGAVIALDSPGDTVRPDSTYSVKATVRNFGNAVESFPVIVAIDVYTDMTLVSGLQPGSAARVTFADGQVPSADSTLYTMTVFTQVSDDYAPHNDTMRKTIFAYDPTGVEEGLNRPSALDFRLWQNSPNPFSRSTGIRYSVADASHISLTVYDVAGKRVAKLVEKSQDPGVYDVRWEGQGQPDGIYFYRLRAGGFTETGKMVLLR